MVSWEDKAEGMSTNQMTEYKLDPEVTAVVAAASKHFSYRQVAIASMYLNQNKARFLVANPDRNCGKAERTLPSGGCVAAAIATVVGR